MDILFILRVIPRGISFGISTASSLSDEQSTLIIVVPVVNSEQVVLKSAS